MESNLQHPSMQAVANSCAFALPVFGFDQLIRTHARHRGELPAFIDGEHVLTWKMFEHRIACVAEALVRDGVRKGERVALLAANSFWAYEVMFGIVRAGAIVTPLSTLLPPALQMKLLADSDARLLMVGQGCERLAAEAVAGLSNGPRLVMEAESPGAHRSFDDFIAQSQGACAGESIGPNDTFGIIYSSGTTGVPKGIMHSHAGRLGLAWQFGNALAVTAQARCLLATPPSSNGTMILLLTAILAGGTCILTRGLSPDDFFQLLAQQRLTHAFLVPTQLSAIFGDERAERADFGGLRCLLSSGAPIPAHVKQSVLRLAGHCFHEAWGFTEGVATVIGPHDAAQRPQSVGRPLPGTDIRVIDAEGAELRPPASGEFVGRSIMMMQGYLNRPDANAQVRWVDANGETFLRTGDIGSIDADGFLTLRGRIKDMIISGGLNVYPSDIEAVLLDHPLVADAAVIGVPHEKWGEAPVAHVIPKAGVDADPAALKEWANARVAKHQRLVDVVVRACDFPRNALGKVLKAELRTAYCSEGLQ